MSVGFRPCEGVRQRADPCGEVTECVDLIELGLQATVCAPQTRIEISQQTSSAGSAHCSVSRSLQDSSRRILECAISLKDEGNHPHFLPKQAELSLLTNVQHEADGANHYSNHPPPSLQLGVTDRLPRQNSLPPPRETAATGLDPKTCTTTSRERVLTPGWEALERRDL